MEKNMAPAIGEAGVMLLVEEKGLAIASVLQLCETHWPEPIVALDR
jgi:hypothetical protein